MTHGFELFRTSIGMCGIAWDGEGVTAVRLPMKAESDTIRALSRGGAIRGDPPPFAREAIRRIVHHLAGNWQDLTGIPLRMSGRPPFHQKVFKALRKVPTGETVTYGALAEKAGSPGAARAVGQAMRENPFAIVVPCHRVVAAGGKPGGFSAFGELVTKSRLLEIEGVRLRKKAEDAELPMEAIGAIRTR